MAVALVITFSVFYAIGLGILGWGIHGWVKSRETKRWRSVEANLETCRFVDHFDEDGASYIVETRYSYSVEGRSYTGDQIAFGYGGSDSEEEHRAIYEKLCDAKKVRVKVNPLNSEECVMAASGRQVAPLIVFGITWIAVITGIALAAIVSSGIDKAIFREITVIESRTGDADQLNTTGGRRSAKLGAILNSNLYRLRKNTVVRSSFLTVFWQNVKNQGMILRLFGFIKLSGSALAAPDFFDSEI